MLTGSYRQDNVLELWDLRTFKKSRDIGWEGPKTNETLENQMDEARLLEDEERKEESPQKDNMSPRKQALEAATASKITRYNPAPFIYAAMFNTKQDIIMAAGAGAN